MEKLYIPYRNGRPWFIKVNGHRLLIVAQDEDSFKEGDSPVQKVKAVESDTLDEEEIKNSLSWKVKGLKDSGVVVAPEGIALSEIIQNLEEQLPWLH